MKKPPPTILMSKFIGSPFFSFELFVFNNINRNPQNSVPLESSKDEDIKKHGEPSPLIQAIKAQKIETVQAILATEIDLNAPENAQALIEAVKRPNLTIVKMLVEKGINPNHRNEVYRTALHYLLANHAFSDDKDLMNLLIEHGAEINSQDSLGNTPLHYASANFNMADLLIKRGANLKLLNKSGHPPLWNIQIEILKNLVSNNPNITYEHFQQQIPEGDDAGKTLFWKIAQFHPWHFRYFFERFEENITVADLCTKDNNNKVSLLYQLASIGFSVNPIFKVWGRFKEELSIDALREIHDFSLLFQIARLHDGTFFLIWDKFKKQFTLADLCAASEKYPNSSALTTMLILCMQERTPKNISFLSELLTQMPGFIPEAQLKSNMSEIKSAINLINTQSQYKVELTAFSTTFPAFASMLAEAKKADNLNDEMLHALFTLASETQKAGYQNAFYEIGKWLLPLNREKAFEALSKVPQQSWHFQEVNLLLADEYLSLANQTPDMIKKQNYLKQSLQAVLSQEPEKNSAKKAGIQKIAVCAIAQENEVVTEKDLPPFIFQLMEEELSVEIWFIHFEQLKEDRKKAQADHQNHSDLMAQLAAMQSELATLRQKTNDSSIKAAENTFLIKKDTPSIPVALQVNSSDQIENSTSLTR